MLSNSIHTSRIKFAVLFAAIAMVIMFTLSSISVFAQEQEEEIPPPTIDTNGDGLPDAWDRDSDGRPDAWDTNADNLPDKFDNDGDGIPDEPTPEE